MLELGRRHIAGSDTDRIKKGFSIFYIPLKMLLCYQPCTDLLVKSPPKVQNPDSMNYNWFGNSHSKPCWWISLTSTWNVLYFRRLQSLGRTFLNRNLQVYLLQGELFGDGVILQLLDLLHQFVDLELLLLFQVLLKLSFLMLKLREKRREERKEKQAFREVLWNIHADSCISMRRKNPLGSMQTTSCKNK